MAAPVVVVNEFHEKNGYAVFQFSNPVTMVGVASAFTFKTAAGVGYVGATIVPLSTSVFEIDFVPQTNAIAAGKYAIPANTVQNISDSVGNAAITAGTLLEAPKVLSAVFDRGTGILTVTFDVAISDNGLTPGQINLRGPTTNLNDLYGNDSTISGFGTNVLKFLMTNDAFSGSSTPPNSVDISTGNLIGANGVSPLEPGFGYQLSGNARRLHTRRLKTFAR